MSVQGGRGRSLELRTYFAGVALIQLDPMIQGILYNETLDAFMPGSSAFYARQLARGTLSHLQSTSPPGAKQVWVSLHASSLLLPYCASWPHVAPLHLQGLYTLAVV